jgi:hypothetical protein
MEKKKKPHVSPEAAKILEQYRNAGKTAPGGADGNGHAGEDEAAPARPSAPPHAPKMRRSGTRGK